MHGSTEETITGGNFFTEREKSDPQHGHYKLINLPLVSLNVFQKCLDFMQIYADLPECLRASDNKPYFSCQNSQLDSSMSDSGPICR